VPERLPRRLITIAVITVVAVAFVAVGGADIARRSAYPLKYETVIARESSAWSVDPYLVAAMIHVESRFDPLAKSSAGAVGLMQVKPSTARQMARQRSVEGKMSAKTLRDPELNIRVGTAYLRYLLDRYGEDESLALAAYNGGLTNADAWAKEASRVNRPLTDVIEFPETASYIRKVRMQRDVYRVLYPDVFGALRVDQ
jgi:soluble lytic murein transglycosylase